MSDFVVNHGKRLRALAMIAALGAGLFGGSAAHAQTIVQDDWEDGTLQGWGPFGSVTLANSTAVAHGGTHSLLTTNRTAGFNGPSLNVTNLLKALKSLDFGYCVAIEYEENEKNPVSDIEACLAHVRACAARIS